jgi:predicted DNA-binding transcriptional regulator YafY
LDAWCHEAKALRTFAVECIQQAKLLEQDCKNISETDMDNYFTRSFGIFSGTPTHTAVLRFSQSAAKWVKDEEWFPDLKAEWLPDGQLELHIPYHNPTELIMEVCRYGADVEVVEPPELRQQVFEKLQKAAAQYT